jgi:hypothetical protein
MDVIFDLFGDPISPRHGRRGRPPHIPTQENRNKVNLLLALGWSNERIANGINVDLKTLKKHYFPELKVREASRDRLDAKVMMTLWAQFQSGNTGAGKTFVAMLEKNDIVVGHSSFYAGQRAGEPETKPDRLGKKELAAQAAETAGEGSDWGDDLKPPPMN